MSITGTWTRLLASERLRRSSQVVSAIGSSVYIFGGEVLPRQPVDNQVDVLSLTKDAPQLKTKAISSAPSPRVGTASSVLNGRLYLFSGRGGVDMAPIEENGVVWSYDAAHASWSTLEPADKSAPYPPARSYHCGASDGKDNVFLHAGCPTTGRLSDLWKFTVSTKKWTELPSAPPPQRGGTSIAYSDGKLYRMNGFDGTTEQGGSIDVFDISTSAWSTQTFTADGKAGPEPRSVCTLLPLRIQGKPKLITLFGERDPSSLGHAGAGKMLGDAWIYNINDKEWTQVQQDDSGDLPQPRGWFDADVFRDEAGSDGIVVHGGLGESNDRLTDVWVLRF